MNSLPCNELRMVQSFVNVPECFLTAALLHLCAQQQHCRLT